MSAGHVRGHQYNAYAQAYLKHDAVYQAKKTEVEKQYCWIPSLKSWATSNSFLKQGCAKVAFVFAYAHDYMIQNRVQTLTFHRTAYQYKEKLYQLDCQGDLEKETRIDNAVRHQFQVFIDSDPGKSAFALAMTYGAVNQTASYQALENEAIHRLQKECGLSNVTLVRVQNTSTQTENDKNQINLTYKILTKNSKNEQVEAGIVNIIGQFDHGTETGSTQFHFALKSIPAVTSENGEKVVEPHKAAQPFTQTYDDYEIDSRTFEKYEFETFPERGLRQCTKDFIKSMYGLDCELEVRYNDDNLENRFCPTCKYSIKHKGQQIGTITSQGNFLSTIKTGHIDFKATFESEDQLKELQEAQQRELEELFEQEAGFNLAAAVKDL